MSSETPAETAVKPEDTNPEEHVAGDDAEALDPAQLKQEFKHKAQAYLAEQTSHVVIPSFSKWFDLSKIHSIEEKLFPDIFSEHGQPSPYRSKESYQTMRDFMVNCYRLNPREYLTVTAVRRNLCGDVSTIIRIHQFLEKWGLINYQIDPRTKPSLSGPQFTGHFQITLDTPTGLIPLLPEDSDSKSSTVENQKPEPTGHHQPLNFEIRRNVYSADSKTSFATSNIVQYFCNVCGKDTTESRYHNLKIKTYSHNPSSSMNNASVVCSVCYDQGLFPSNFHTSDFIKLSKNQDIQQWSEQEVLLLLEGIEMFGTYESTTANGSINANSNSQWDKIAEHVATKSREQCIMKFIQLPIEDKYLTKFIDSSNNTDEKNVEGEIDQKTLIPAIVKQLIADNEGAKLIANNVESNLQKSILEQTDLINQISELTLTKLNHKLKKIDSLQENILKIEHQLSLERKQVLIERWVQYEKLQKLKQDRPDLANILDDLMKPIKIEEISKSLRSEHQTIIEEDSTVETPESNGTTNDKLPVSIAKPKTYQYWSG
jgi:chromatin structure-remodeling complex subunit RSC8